MFDYLKNQLVAALYCAAALLGRVFGYVRRQVSAGFEPSIALRLHATASVALCGERPWMPQRGNFRRKQTKNSSDDDEAHLRAA